MWHAQGRTLQHLSCCYGRTEGRSRDYSQTYLPAPGLNHELSGQMWGWLRLQGSDDDALVQGVTGHNLKQDQGMRAMLAAGLISKRA